MKIKTSELIDDALDWAVWFINHSNASTPDELAAALSPYSPSTDWSQGGPIIEREEITIKHVIPAMKDSMWQAHPSMSAKGAGGRWGIGPSPLIAAMRCYVASKMGDEVDVPEELLR